MTQMTGSTGEGWPPAQHASYYPGPGLGGPGFQGPADTRHSRGPGWGGVIAISVMAALFSAVTTAGALTVLGGQGTTTDSAAQDEASSSAAAATGKGAVPDWGAVATAAEPSVVSVRVGAGSQGSGGSGIVLAESSGEGSGIILDTRGRILTNNHVASAAGPGGSIGIVLSDGRYYKATIVGTDPSTDLAVIAMTKPPAGLKPAVFGDSAAVKVGDPVMAIGNPLGLAHTATTGIVSALNRPVNTGSSEQNPLERSDLPQSEQVVTNAIQTDAAINPGNSGGALVDAAGRVIGITSSGASLPTSNDDQTGSIGLNFAIPSNEAKNAAGQLISSGTVQHAYLGVTLADGVVAVDTAIRQAAVVGTVSADTPAAKAGLQAKDAIIAVNGQAVDGTDSLVDRVRALKPATVITLTIVRDGQKADLKVTLAVRPDR